MTFEMPAVVRERHPYFMHDELQAQPTALRRAFAAGRDAGGRELLNDREPIYLTGCGTSFHAAITSEFWLRTLGVAPNARAVEAFELTTGPYPFASSTVVAFSQSGGKGATVSAAARARRGGAEVLSVIGHEDSPLAGAASRVVWTGYPDEVSWAHTISYTTSLMAFLGLVIDLTGPDDELVEQAERLPDAVGAQLREDAPLQQLAAHVGGRSRVFVIGSGANYGTALETALKLRETSYKHADAQNAEYFLHGPISSLDSEALVVAIAPPDDVRARTLDVLRATRTIGAPTIVLGEIGDGELREVADYFIELAPLREELTPLLYIVPLHMLSYWLAVEAGLNPDLIRRDQRQYREAREAYEL
ncbi:MAG TPA: SIS domain-containing protein [Dehalococcoidia bacterium]|nr:SIS domain-containing protein [Dehalococcoidia bacterium]